MVGVGGAEPRFEVGSPVRVVTTKWVDRPHWEYDAHYLGADEHGDWLGIPRGTHLSRPEMSFDAETDQVTLVPRADAGGGGWWVATFHAPGFRVATYVDMTSLPVWTGARVSAIDLDLDVIRRADGTSFVDDEDEFAEHQVAHDYPPATVRGARDSCTWVHGAVLSEVAPFDAATSLRWLDRVVGAVGVVENGPDAV